MATALPAGNTGIVSRAIRAARLERAVYEEVEADTTATTGAAIVVVVGAVASGLAVAGAATAGAVPGAGGGFVAALIAQIIGALLGWAAYAYATFLVGTTILKGAETHADWGQVARTLGFASAPRVVFLVALVPGLFTITSIVVFVWLIAATIVAVQAALDVSTGRAVGIAVVAAIALAVVQSLVGLLI